MKIIEPRLRAQAFLAIILFSLLLPLVSLLFLVSSGTNSSANTKTPTTQFNRFEKTVCYDPAFLPVAVVPGEVGFERRVDEGGFGVGRTLGGVHAAAARFALSGGEASERKVVGSGRGAILDGFNLAGGKGGVSSDAVDNTSQKLCRCSGSLRRTRQLYTSPPHE
ncbi:hypothetical protein GQ44DRAFT_732085 [Phaeosphaeriaceae sp. PMI808]|nr:hypothetical protein GQ44DRAFT_732085 [Phaeosphaeriaceae sp. PMI808]